MNEKLLEDELNYLRNVFIEVNDYLPKLVNSTLKIELKQNSSYQQELTINATSKQIQLVLRYIDKGGNNLVRKMNRQLLKHLKDYVKVMITNQGTRHSSRFQVKDQTKYEHKTDVVYWCKCLKNDSDDFYIRETDRQISERIIDHNKRGKIHIPYNMHTVGKTADVWVNDFTVLNSNYRSKIKKKISRSLYIR